MKIHERRYFKALAAASQRFPDELLLMMIPEMNVWVPSDRYQHYELNCGKPISPMGEMVDRDLNLHVCYNEIEVAELMTLHEFWGEITDSAAGTNSSIYDDYWLGE